MLVLHQAVDPFAPRHALRRAVVLRQQKRGQRQIIRSKELLPKLPVGIQRFREFCVRIVLHGQHARQRNAHIPPEGGKDAGVLIDQIPAGAKPVRIRHSAFCDKQIGADGRQIAAVPLEGLLYHFPAFSKALTQLLQ